MKGTNYRAWDIENKKWFHPSLFIITDAGFYATYREFEDGISLFDYEYELMQNTGLKDKNGESIFVGDILKWNEEEFGSPFNELVDWDYEQFSSRENDWKNHCEIIGNKFDNPELLEKEK